MPFYLDPAIPRMPAIQSISSRQDCEVFGAIQRYLDIWIFGAIQSISSCQACEVFEVFGVFRVLKYSINFILSGL